MVEEQEVTQEDIDAMEDLQDEQAEDQALSQYENQQEFADGYGAPEPEEKQNQHSFLFKSAFDSRDTLKTTYLEPEELGRPLFNIRFLLDMEDIAKFYLDKLAIELNVENKVADYFKQKIHNVTDSGMSRDGFTANLNVTRKMDSMRTRRRVNPIDNLQGGKKKK